MGTQIITQPQTFKSSSTVMGAAAGLSAVAGLTVYGNISASGTIYGTTATLAPIKTTVTSTGAATYSINGYTNDVEENYLVYLDGVHQVPGSDYTITSNQITFSPAPAVGVVADVLAFQSSVAAYSLSGIAPVLNTAAGTGSQTSFAINGFTNTTPQNYLVVVGGLVQLPGTDYTAAGGNILFTSTPPSGVQIMILAYQVLPGTANNTTVQVQTNAGATSTVSILDFDNGLSARVIGGTADIRLPAGTAGQVLTYNGSTSTWVASAAPGSAGGSITSGTAVTLTNQTSVDFTGIPSTAKRITVMFDGISTNGSSSSIQFQIGTSSGVESTGYISGNAFGSIASGFVLGVTPGAGYLQYGTHVFTLLSGNTWIQNGNSLAATIAVQPTCGSKTLDSTLTRVRLTTVNGTDQFDSGTVNIMWE